MSRLRTRLQTHRRDAGFIIPFLVISVSVLFLLIGFAVDIGNWYLQASKLQNASDAAALAGVVKMPDSAAAEATAADALRRNGYTDGGNIHISYAEDATNHLEVTLANSDIKSVFVRPVLDHISLTRESKAEYHKAVEMGTPFNVLGSGWLAMTGAVQAEPENYWLGVNGYCTAKSDGDYRLSRYDGNKYADHTDCPDPDPTHLNPNYDANGYDFAIEIPSGAGPTSIEVYDPAFNSALSALDMEAGRVQEVVARGPSQVDTSYTLYDATTVTNASLQPQVGPAYLAKSSDATCLNMWCSIFTGQPGHTYRLNVHTLAGQLNSTGVNAFSLWAHTTSGPDTCDSRSNPTMCPVVHGINALSVFTTGSGTGNNTASIYMAEIDPGEAEQTLNVGLWDPGEGAHYVELQAPDNSSRPVKYTSLPDTAGLDGNNVTQVDVSGNGTQVWSYDPEPARYNDRLLTLSTRVPYDYASWQTGTNRYWKMGYVGDSGTNLPWDRTTWMLNVEDTSPAHLISTR